MTERADGDEQQLRGGVANAGSVTRQNDHVLRPSTAHTGVNGSTPTTTDCLQRWHELRPR